jgi:hypothetical protein
VINFMVKKMSYGTLKKTRWRNKLYT